MDIFEALFTRRSIRNFTGEPISANDLKIILRAGCYAPSANNCQPWHFIVIQNSIMLQTIAKEHRHAKMLPQAGCCILVCGDKEKQAKTGFLVEDCSACMQNMLLAAHGLGLGAVWCGLYPLTRYILMMKKFLNLPEKMLPVGMMAVGHKNETQTTDERFDETKIHYEQW